MWDGIFQEPSNKRVRTLAKVSSLVNLISPSKNGAVRRFGQSIQVNVNLFTHLYHKIRCNCLSYKRVNLYFPISPQSMSLRNDGKSPGTTLKAPSKAPAMTPTKRRNSTLWSETLDVHQKSAFSAKEIKRQEVVWVNIFKMAQGNRKVNRLYLSCRQFMNFSGASRTSSRICNWHERLGKRPAN